MPGSRPSEGAAEAIRRLIDGIDPQKLGAEMHAAVRELYPICRSITGEGLRRSLRMLQRIAPLELHEVPTGTPVFDWRSRESGTCGERGSSAPDGEVVVDTERLNLHVLNYSVPFSGKVPLEELAEAPPLAAGTALAGSLPHQLLPRRLGILPEPRAACESSAGRIRRAHRHEPDRGITDVWRARPAGRDLRRCSHLDSLLPSLARQRQPLGHGTGCHAGPPPARNAPSITRTASSSYRGPSAPSPGWR